MKYIKTYELKIFGKEVVWELKLKVGDYVVINDINRKHFCKIISIAGSHYRFTSNNSTYYGELANGKKRIFFKDDFSRYMTPEEIEEFELEKNVNKYNL